MQQHCQTWFKNNDDDALLKAIFPGQPG